MKADKGRIDYELLIAQNGKIMELVTALRRDVARSAGKTTSLMGRLTKIEKLVKTLREELVEAQHGQAVDRYAEKVRHDNSAIPGEKGPKR